MEHLVENSELTRGNQTPRVNSSIKTPDNVKVNRLKRSYRQIRTENVFKKTLIFMALAIFLLVVGIMVTLIVQSVPSMKLLGVKYLWGKCGTLYRMFMAHTPSY